MADLYADVVGQDQAVGALRAATRAPVHAYLLVGPPGSGKRAAARSFAASLLCRQGGCGQCADCRRALAEGHPDLAVVERAAAFIRVDEAREITRMAVRSPLEGRYQVLVLVDFHLVDKAAPALLKTIEEPPPTTVFVVLAEHLAPALVTLASRCARIDFVPLSPDALVAQLRVEGIDERTAREAAAASGGRMDRARLLASDPAITARLARWREAPQRLDGTGSAVASVVDELLASADATLEPLRSRQTAELEVLASRSRMAGERGIPGQSEVQARHRREQRRWRTDELRYGLAAMAGVYRDRLLSTSSTGGGATGRLTAGWVQAIQAIQAAAAALDRNPNETLLLQGLALGLPAAVPMEVGAPMEGGGAQFRA